MHRVHTVGDGGAFGYEDWGFAIWSTSGREDGIVNCCSGIDGDGRIEA